MDRLTSMEVFVHVVERGGFAAAAKEADISPAMVGKHIRALEQRLGARLLNRTTRRQSLSEVGRLYYERCKQLLADAQIADRSGDELRQTPRGVLRLTSPVTFGTQRLVPALAEFLQRHPDVQAELALNDREVDLIEEGYEAAIRIGTLGDTGLIARPLQPYRLILCASPEYLARHGLPRQPRELERHCCLGFSYWSRRDQWSLHGADGEQRVTVRGNLYVNNGQALRMAALSGLGIVMQPEALLADDVAAGRLLRVLPKHAPRARPMHLVYPPDRRPTAKLRAFIDFMVERFGQAG